MTASRRDRFGRLIRLVLALAATLLVPAAPLMVAIRVASCVRQGGRTVLVLVTAWAVASGVLIGLVIGAGLVLGARRLERRVAADVRETLARRRAAARWN